MSAYHTFWEASWDQRKIPVAFSFATSDGDRGLAAQGIPITGNPEAQRLAFSDEWKERAAAAVLALDFARQSFAREVSTESP